MNTPEVSGEIVVLGQTSAGKVFRPSDWAERLACNLASFGQNRQLCYSPLVQPVVRQGVSCLVVSKSIETSEPDSYLLLMEFASNNDLKIVEGRIRPRE
ncbi:MAG: DUF3579 domain-containing protein [Sulfuricellaceae bacterium]|nr:DUF3579 domain-containing protein [Sulfuricellaceae bacterium]